MLPRTKIFRVRPQGLDTGLRESLLSLVIRTAAENDASPAKFISDVLATESALPTLRRCVQAIGKHTGQTINGRSEITARIASRVEELTHYSSLNIHTTIPFAPFATINGLLRNTLAWEPRFLSQASPPYYPLVWALEAARVCPKSGLSLRSLCPHCRREVAVLSGGAQIGRCPHCQGGLDSDSRPPSTLDRVASKIQNRDFEHWVAQQLDNYITDASKVALPPDFNYQAVFNRWLGRFGLPTAERTAAMLDVSYSALHNWSKKGAIPCLRQTMVLCWRFGVSLSEYLWERTPSKSSGSINPAPEKRARFNEPSLRRPIVRSKLEEQLKHILDANQYPLLPFTTICEQKLDRKPEVVRELFPEYARAVSRRYLQRKELIAARKRVAFCAELKETARSLHSIGTVPNHKTLQPFMESPTKMRCHWAIAAINEVRMELGYDRISEQLLLAI